VSVIEVEGLRKRYRRLRGSTLALDGLSFEVPEGGVFGFLGPNGAGKTTTIRCLIKHINPSAGSARVLGTDVNRIHEVIHRVGVTVEGPGFFQRYTALENLTHLGGLIGMGEAEASRLLEKVGLDGREDDPVGTYSTGMRQRLALAAALLKDPELLILDEPAQGLDPEGIRDIRILLREAGAEGRTVFLSSHLLSEVEAICDRVGIVSKGELLRMGSVQEILDEIAVPRVVVVTRETQRAADILRAAGFETSTSGEEITVELGASKHHRVNQVLSESGVFADEVRRVAPTLEDAYLKWSEGGR
jgi:ABC-2 type transport system ATP-binding protein